MTGRMWVRQVIAGAALAAVLPLAGCTDEINSAVEKADGVAGKAGACTEALGIATSFNPESLDPQQVREQAEEKAKRLQELGNNAADANVRETLLTMADGYVELERKQAEGLGNLTDWVRRNTENIERLRQVCL
ncbi:hypothetical protein SAMN05216266_12763 [Amycolatopsis marina]|uniref:Uncharacterized protein n=1 Tax=Amycolatopsis marina TaxID=490629 RepID=A0A1I1CGS1_9PSEU|nr:hypothetical protein [Amycolatopsis marina]SFB61242.1 hypothetical protein SAMN05216266_12763 [Amycolatopsis marina]